MCTCFFKKNINKEKGMRLCNVNLFKVQKSDLQVFKVIIITRITESCIDYFFCVLLALQASKSTRDRWVQTAPCREL